MVTERKDGGQAFPHGDPTNGGDVGMTLRDYFAAHALAAIITADGIPYAADEKHQKRHAAMAYGHADAMLMERDFHSDEWAAAAEQVA